MKSKKRYIIIFLFVLIVNNFYAQNHNSIYYKIPDETENKIINFLKQSDKIKEVYFVLNSFSLDSFGIEYHTYKPEMEIAAWIRATNRYLCIDTISFPLLFNSDFSWAISNNLQANNQYSEEEFVISRIEITGNSPIFIFKRGINTYLQKECIPCK